MVPAEYLREHPSFMNQNQNSEEEWNVSSMIQKAKPKISMEYISQRSKNEWDEEAPMYRKIQNLTVNNRERTFISNEDIISDVDVMIVEMLGKNGMYDLKEVTRKFEGFKKSMNKLKMHNSNTN